MSDRTSSPLLEGLAGARKGALASAFEGGDACTARAGA